MDSLRSTLAIVAGLALLAPNAGAQFWDKLTKPKIVINLTHPPKLGLQLKKLAMGPMNGPCAEEVATGLQSLLLSSGIEVLDRQNLEAILAEHRFSLSGYVDTESAAQLGKMLGPSALVFVKLTRCHPERKLTYKDRKTSQRVIRTHFAITEVHIRGTFQYLYIQILREAGRKSNLDNAAVGQLRDDHQFAEFEASGKNVFSERGDVVSVSVRHFLDQTMQTQAFEQARNLPAVEMRQEAAQRFILQPADVELAGMSGFLLNTEF